MTLLVNTTRADKSNSKWIPLRAHAVKCEPTQKLLSAGKVLNYEIQNFDRSGLYTQERIYIDQ